MVKPAWFFSTLAQSTAAAVGFVIAFLASQYSVRRGRFRERAKNAEDDVVEFVNKYSGEFEEVYEELLRFDHTDDPRSVITDLKAKSSRREYREWSESKEERALAMVYWVNRLFSQIESAAEPRDVFKNFTALSYPINDLQDSCVGFPRGHDWLTRVREMKDEHGTIDTKIHELNNAMDEDDIGPVIRLSKILFIIGVVIPTAFLATVPEETNFVSIPELDGILLLSIQMFNLLAVVAVSLRLFKNLQNVVDFDLF